MTSNNVTPISGAAELLNGRAHEHRRVPLDALRGIAIALVVIHHVWWRFPSLHDDSIARFVAGIGWAGVDLFFGISGYLITTILMKSSGLSAIRAFFIKRFFRIIPIYLVALAAFVGISLLTGNDREVLDRVWINLLLLTAWFIPFLGENGVPFTITWSVSVEEFAYLLFGTLAAIGVRYLTGSLKWVAILALLIRFAFINWLDFSPSSMYYFAPGRIDAIALGGLAATLSGPLLGRLLVRPWVMWLLWLTVVAVCSLLQRESQIVATYGYSAIAIVSAWLVLCVGNMSGATHWCATKWLASLGLVSYFVYLFHGFGIAAMNLVLPGAFASNLSVEVLSVVAVFLTYIPALVSWKYFERPMIALGRRLADKSRDAAVA